MHENIGALNILVDKLEGYIEELCNLLLGRIIDREVQIARDMLLGMVEEKSSASSDNGFNFMFSIKKLTTRKQRKAASSTVVGDKDVS